MRDKVGLSLASPSPSILEILSVAISPRQRKQEGKVQIKWRVLIYQPDLDAGKPLKLLNLGLLESIHLHEEERSSRVSQKPDWAWRTWLSPVLGLPFSLHSKTIWLPLGRSRGTPSLFRPRNRGSAAGANLSLRSGGGRCWAPAPGPYLRRRDLKHARDLGVELLDTGEILHSARGASVGQLRVENQPAGGRRRAGQAADSRIRMLALHQSGGLLGVEFLFSPQPQGHLAWPRAAAHLRCQRAAASLAGPLDFVPSGPPARGRCSLGWANSRGPSAGPRLVRAPSSTGRSCTCRRRGHQPSGICEKKSWTSG